MYPPIFIDPMNLDAVYLNKDYNDPNLLLLPNVTFVSPQQLWNRKIDR